MLNTPTPLPEPREANVLPVLAYLDAIVTAIAGLDAELANHDTAGLERVIGGDAWGQLEALRDAGLDAESLRAAIADAAGE